MSEAVLRQLTRLLELQREVRRAPTAARLAFVATNRTQAFVPALQAVLLRRSGKRTRIEAASATGTVDEGSPYARALLSLLARASAEPVEEVSELPAEFLETAGFAGGACLVRARLSEERELVLLREAPLQTHERGLLDELVEIYAQGFSAVDTPAAPTRALRVRRGAIAAVALLCGLALLLPVRQTTLAPAELVPSAPAPIVAPMAGVIDRVLVAPGESVTAGQIVARLDDADLRAERDRRAEEVALARERVRRAAQSGLARTAPNSAPADDARLRERELAVATLALASADERLARSRLVAPRAGTAIYADQDRWVGRPVRTGERILSIADPEALELEIRLPATAPIVLEPGDAVAFYPDALPLDERSGRLTTVAPVTDVIDDVLVYRLRAQLDDLPEQARVGWLGTARLHGDEVRLYRRLLRTPMRRLRLWFGL